MSASVPADVELIVLDWDGGELLTKCLQSIDAQTRKPARVIILDNGSRVSVYQRLAKNILRVPYVIVRADTNLGFTGGINRAMAEVRAPYVGWINNDVVLSEKWLETLLPVVSGEGKIAGTQSIIVRDKNTIDGAGITIEDGTFRQIGHGQKVGSLRQMTQPWGISATAALYRVHALQEAAIRGAILRPDLFAYYEDVELCARLRARGWKFKLVPEALAMHRGSASASRLGWSGLRMRVRNRYIVAHSHAGVGKVSALFTEDMSQAVRGLLHGQFRYAMTHVSGAIAGVRKKTAAQ